MIHSLLYEIKYHIIEAHIYFYYRKGKKKSLKDGIQGEILKRELSSGVKENVAAASKLE